VKKKSTLHIKPLPKEEWDFSEVIEKYGVDHVFFYEYSRSCARAYKDFQLLIDKAKILFGTSLKKKPKSSILKNKDKEIESFFNHPIGQYIFILRNIEGFPKLPLILNDNYRKYFEFGLINLGIYPKSVTFFPLNHLNISADNWDSSLGEPMEESMEGPSDLISSETFQKKSAFMGAPTFGDSGFTTYSLLGFNWAFPDKDIKNEINRFLKSNRPPRYNKDKDPSKHFGIKGTPLNVKRKNALEWLSFWRKFQHARNWDNYFQLFEEDWNPQEDSLVAKIRLQLQIKKTEVILEWFCEGGIIKSSRKGQKKRHDVKYWKDLFPESPSF